MSPGAPSPSGSGLVVEYVPGTWRRGASPETLEAAAARRRRRTTLKAVVVVHNETSTGVVSRIARAPARDEPMRASGAPHRGRHLVARRPSTSPRRVGSRRDGLRLAEGADGAAGPRLQRDLREGARARTQDRAAAASRTGTGRRCSRPTRPASFRTRRRPTCSTGCAKRCGCSRKKGSTTCLLRHARSRRGARAAAVRAWGLDIVPEDPSEYSNSLTAVLHARGSRRGSAAADHPRALRHVARHRPGQVRRQGVSHRPSRLRSTI